MKKRFLFGGIVVVFVVATFLLVHQLQSKNNTTVTVQVSASGFSPNALVVKAGTHVIWKNVDSAPHAVAANPYPSSASLKSLHSQSIAPGGSYEYAVTKAGTINYHDDTQPTHNASIKVEK